MYKPSFLLIIGIAILGSLFQSCGNRGCTDIMACNYDAGAEKDDGSCLHASIWYEDLDRDGLGNPHASVLSCIQPIGYVSNASDDFDAEMTSRQRATVFYIGATWCSPCGTYGDPLRNLIYSSYNAGSSNDAVLISLQRSDLITAETDFSYDWCYSLNDFMGESTIPKIYWVAEDVPMDLQIHYHDWWAVEDTVAYHYDLLVNDNASIGLAADAHIEGDEVMINAKIHFYQSRSAEQYISYYLLEDSVMALQTYWDDGPRTAVTSHPNVLRASRYESQNGYGTYPIGSSFSAAESININETIPLPDNIEREDMLYLAVLIWDGTTPDDIVNSYIARVY